MVITILLSIALSTATVPPSTATAKLQPALPLDLEVRVRPTPLVANGKTQLVYELHITNFSSIHFLLEALEVIDGHKTVLVRQTAEELEQTLLQPGQTKSDVHARSLAPGSRTVVFLWFSVDHIPSTLSHRVYVQKKADHDSGQWRAIEGAPVVVDNAHPLEVGPPLEGGPWLVANGPSNSSAHRRAFNVVNGTARIAERYAIDWIKFCSDGRLFRSDSKSTSDWCAYGSRVIAVADATVVAAQDGLPDEAPGSIADDAATLERIAGNHVVLDLGSEHFALYAHLKPGSLRVKPGDQVHRGQLLAQLGNSGNTDAPHLHFQIANSPSPLGAEGIPYRFPAFDVLGSLATENGTDTPWKPSHGPQRRLREVPLENMVIQFP